MRGPKHPRQFTEEFRRQIVALVDSGKPRADAPLSAFGIERSVSRPGNPCDSAVVESTNGALKRELVRGRAFPSEGRLGTGLFDWVNRYDNYRPHSTLGYMTPAGFREAGLILS